MHSRSLRGIARFLYTQNPFYLISAGLVLYGLQALYSEMELSGPMLLAVGIAVYITITAITAVLIIRWGKVWDDARSLLVILALLFQSLSVSLDELAATSPYTAARLLTVGWVFCILVLELVLRCSRLRVHGKFRLPLYMILGLMFLAPVIMSPEWDGWLSHWSVMWRVTMFGAVAGAAFLGLLPAAWAGKALSRNNGSPWPWPLMPWSMFIMLAIGNEHSHLHVDDLVCPVTTSARFIFWVRLDATCASGCHSDL